MCHPQRTEFSPHNILPKSQPTQIKTWRSKVFCQLEAPNLMFQTSFCHKQQSPTCHEAEHEHKDGGVAEVENGGHDSADVQFGSEEVDAVRIQVNRREAGRQERTPPPVVVLAKQICPCHIIGELFGT